MFNLDERFVRDSEFVISLGLCQLRLQNDSRWPWLVMIPQRNDLSEVFELSPLDQTMLTFEMNLVAKALKEVTGADKMNVGALGNIVRQLHVHVIARNEGDANWPGPVWGFEKSIPYNDTVKAALIAKLKDAFQ